MISDVISLHCQISLKMNPLILGLEQDGKVVGHIKNKAFNVKPSRNPP